MEQKIRQITFNRAHIADINNNFKCFDNDQTICGITEGNFVKRPRDFEQNSQDAAFCKPNIVSELILSFCMNREPRGEYGRLYYMHRCISGYCIQNQGLS